MEQTLYIQKIEDQFSKSLCTKTLSKSLLFWKERFEFPLFQILQEDQDIQKALPLVQNFKNRFEDVIIFGTGGSSLGGKVLTSSAKPQSLRLHFLENPDPTVFHELIKTLDLTKTGVVTISKSGQTPETLMQFFCMLSVWKEQSICPRDHCVIITQDHISTLKASSVEWKIPCLDHPALVGGRFSVFSLTALFPAMLTGIDPYLMRKGALQILNQSFELNSPPAMGALFSTLYQRPMHVMMPYQDHLVPFTFWWRQLWAESLGKNGKGTTPLNALGTVDQHSQLQLYLDGPKDKIFTLIMQNSFENDIKPKNTKWDLGNYFMGDLLNASAQGTYESLKNAGNPVRLFQIKSLNEQVLGALLMHFMLETIFAADLLEVNAFDQEAVEKSKILTRTYLKKEK